MNSLVFGYFVYTIVYFDRYVQVQLCIFPIDFVLCELFHTSNIVCNFEFTGNTVNCLCKADQPHFASLLSTNFFREIEYNLLFQAGCFDFWWFDKDLGVLDL